MFSKIVIGYDRTEHGDDALALGRLLARTTGSKLILAHVFVEEFPPDIDWEESVRSFRETVEAELAAIASADVIPAEARAVAGSSPVQGLYDLAEAQQADLIVVGSSHHGALGRVLMGSVPERLLHGAPCAIAVAPRGYRNDRDAGLGVIGVAFDGSQESRAASAAAAEIAAAAGASVRLLAVLLFGSAEVPSAYDRETLDQAERQRLERAVEAAVSEMSDVVRAKGEILEGEVAQTLASRAERGIDLLVAGSRGHGPVRRALLGSVSTQLARSVPCPLLVVPKSAATSESSD